MKTLSFNRGLSIDGNTLTLEDVTDYTTLPARNTLALIPYITFIPHGGTLQVIAPQAYDPLTVVTFSVGIDGKDGIYYAKFFAIPKYTVGVLTEGDIVYEVSTSTVKQYVGGELVAFTAWSTLHNNAEINYGEADTIIRIELSKRKDLLQLLVLQKLEALAQKKCEHGEYAEALRNFNYIRALWVGAFLQFCMGNKVTAQRYIETGNELGFKILKV